MSNNTETITPEELEQFKRYRNRRKRESDYRNQYAKDNYKRLICLLPIERYDLFEQAKGEDATSTYICDLIYADMRKKGLL